jgi:hypothetical protein
VAPLSVRPRWLAGACVALAAAGVSQASPTPSVDGAAPAIGAASAGTLPGMGDRFPLPAAGDADAVMEGKSLSIQSPDGGPHDGVATRRGVRISVPPPAESSGSTLHDLGRWALARMRDVIPGNAPPDTGTASHAVPVLAGDLILPAEVHRTASQAFARRVERPPATTSTTGVASSEKLQSAADDPPTSARREALETDAVSYRLFTSSRRLMGHPLTWLALILAGVVHIGLSRSRRRRKRTGRRWMKPSG